MMRKLFLFSIASGLFMILSSCASTNRSAGSLSDAMEKASDEHQGERKIVAVSDPEQEEEPEEVYEYPQTEREETGVVFEQATKDMLVGVTAGTGMLSTESFYGMTSFSVGLEQFYQSKRSAFIELGGFYSPLQTVESDKFDPASDTIVQALDGGIFSLYAQIRLRFYTTPKHTFLGNYFGFGAGVHSMFWNYRNDLEITEYDEFDNPVGTDTVSNDQLWGLDLNGSAGINIIQAEHFVLGAEFIPGIIIWGPETYQGFTNDVFAPFFYLKTNFNFMIR